MSAPGPVLVFLATGNQGKAVIKSLLALPTPPSKILAVTRSAASPSAQKLVALSPDRIKLVEGDYTNVPGIFKAAQTAAAPDAVWGVYSVQLAQGLASKNELAEGKAVVDAAISNKVKHFVYSSVERGGDEKSWTNPTNVPHFASKHDIELYLREKADANPGMTWTILRPVAFMDNFFPGMQTRVFLASLKTQLGASKKSLQWVATRDIGFFAAKSFENPDEWNKKAVGLAGDDVTIDQLAEKFKKVTGKPVTPTLGIFGSALNMMMKEMGVMVKWFGAEGFAADVAKCKQTNPGMQDWESWIKESAFASKSS